MMIYLIHWKLLFQLVTERMRKIFCRKSIKANTHAHTIFDDDTMRVAALKMIIERIHLHSVFVCV